MLDFTTRRGGSEDADGACGTQPRPGHHVLMIKVLRSRQCLCVGSHTISARI
jgi:hypothetical protein